MHFISLLIKRKGSFCFNKQKEPLLLEREWGFKNQM